MLNFMMSEETKAAMEIPYVLPEDKKVELQTAIFTRLEYFDGLYHPETTAINMMLDRWANEKGDLIRLFERSPFYNGNFQIVFPADYTREIDYDTVARYLSNFSSYCYEMINNIPEAKFGVYTYGEIANALRSISRKLDLLWDCEINGIPVAPFYKGTLEEDNARMREVEDKIHRSVAYDNTYVQYHSKVYHKEDYNAWKYWRGATDYLYDHSFRLTQNATEEIVTRLSTGYPGALTGKNKKERTIATTGQKMSRIINRMAKETGFDQTPEGNSEAFGKFADAINPLNVTRWTVLSIHPLDFYNMSNGNSWRSCHTLDKRNKDGLDFSHNYNGCYGGGTGSYMEDGVSFIFYTVMPDENKDGVHLELSHKATRCMFHLGNNFLVQGRMYPQETDGKIEVYKEAREIVQRIIAECLGVPNLWKNEKGTDECCKVITSRGAHYRDYEHYSNCNVSYLKNGNEVVDKRPPKIIVGSLHTCPSCGKLHDKQDNVECEACNGIDGSDSARQRARNRFLGNSHIQGMGDCVCAECGQICNADDMNEIDGSLYCDECSFYCEHHGMYEVGNPVYVNNTDALICEEAFDWSSFYERCDSCGEIYDTRESEDAVTIGDGWNTRHYCCSECAHNDDYVQCSDGEWRHREDCVLCDWCNEYMDADNGDYLVVEDGTIFCSESCARRGGYVKCADGTWEHRCECEMCSDDGKFYLTSEMIQTPDGHWFRDWDAAERHGYHEQNTEVDEGVA